MHAPDGFLTVGTALATGAISVGAVGLALRQTRTALADRQIPLAGVAAAFVFAAQMVNFPVAGGTTGHLLGGALVACLLGPSVAVVVLAVVVAVQALAFADGGVTALGYNVLNMAVVTSLGGYAIFVALRRLAPRNGTGVALAAGLAAFASVPLSAMAFSLEWLFGASAPVAFDTVFTAVVGVHLLIGVGEGVVTGLVVASVLATRPDLVHGASHLTRAQAAEQPRVGLQGPLLGGVIAAFFLGMVVSQFAADGPDGLEQSAAQAGFDDAATDSVLSTGPFAGYATRGVQNDTASLAVAGAAGVALTVVLGVGVVLMVRRRPGAVEAAVVATANAS